MNEKSQISYSALIQELQQWQLTLRRQLNRLIFLKNQISKTNTKLTNQIQILQIQIQSELLKYKKQKQKKNIDFQYVINRYNAFSKKFVHLIQTINQIHEHHTYSNSPLPQKNIHNSMKNSQRINASSQINLKSPKKRYLDDTFTTKMARQPSNKTKNKSMSRIQKPNMNKYSTNATWLEGLIKQAQEKRNKIDSKIDKNYQTKQRILLQKHNNQIKSKLLAKNVKYLCHQSQDSENIQMIRSQLNQIKSTILDMSKKIDSHQHEQYDKQINKLKHNNKKILLDIKIIKQQNTNFLHQIYQIRKQIGQQKKLQMSMIKQFQKPRKVQVDKSLKFPQDVSDWVKVRLQKS